eukprot:Plantae.Rhodophyta-Hildenbrandia_rubra.ctg17156.p3 GENE.Plantae.Rhodophyta-Hildenbrandia_rubra.ctg17156~~Plantae.Rhodophyta-Hildenbrandia_rubra.ctg17156.p3  ORF type:complete len:240 (+),score=69.59 Plantae.Rhodophyta-Hildenbrandia_rubra.ctg17156:3246-3965(+)
MTSLTAAQTKTLAELLAQLEEATRELAVRRDAISPSILITPEAQSPQQLDEGPAGSEEEFDNVESPTQITNDDLKGKEGRRRGMRDGDRIRKEGRDKIVEGLCDKMDDLEEEVVELRRENKRLGRKVESMGRALQKLMVRNDDADWSISDDLSDNDDSRRRRKRRRRHKGGNREAMSGSKRELMEARAIARHLMGQLKTIDVGNTDAEVRYSGLMVKEMEKAAKESRKEAELLRQNMSD